MSKDFGADDDRIGSLGEETTRLLNAVQDWTRRTTADAPIATGAAECQWCPVCQLVGVLRGDRPELTDLAERAAEIARTAVTALAAAFATHSHGPTSAEPATEGAEDGADSRPSGGPARRVERITLDADPIDGPFGGEPR